MTTQSALEFYPTATGCVVRVIGRGTLQQSPTVRQFTMRCVQEQGLCVVMDLSRCGYLDSTFLGCLVALNQNCCPAHNRRFMVYVDEEDRGRLFGLTQIDKILHYVDELPEPLDGCQTLTGEALDTAELGRHILDAHQRLARLGGPEAESFQSVADQMAKELEKRQNDRRF